LSIKSGKFYAFLTQFNGFNVVTRCFLLTFAYYKGNWLYYDKVIYIIFVDDEILKRHKMKILLHTCCAICLDRMMNGLKEEFGKDIEVTGYFYNPNIHPLIEFRKRLKAVKVLNESFKMPFMYDDEYNLDIFMREVWKNGESERCRRCYDERLGKTAKTAFECGFDVFSSTLCVSEHQSHECINQAGFEAAEKWGLEFLYRDYRKYCRTTPKRQGIYSQQYCGCVFSEYRRFQDTTKELYKG
jgi:hypothetical protein